MFLKLFLICFLTFCISNIEARFIDRIANNVVQDVLDMVRRPEPPPRRPPFYPPPIMPPNYPPPPPEYYPHNHHMDAHRYRPYGPHWDPSMHSYYHHRPHHHGGPPPPLPPPPHHPWFYRNGGEPHITTSSNVNKKFSSPSPTDVKSEDKNYNFMGNDFETPVETPATPFQDLNITDLETGTNDSRNIYPGENSTTININEKDVNLTPLPIPDINSSFGNNTGENEIFPILGKEKGNDESLLNFDNVTVIPFEEEVPNVNATEKINEVEHVTVPIDDGRNLIRVPKRCSLDSAGNCRSRWI